MVVEEPRLAEADRASNTCLVAMTGQMTALAQKWMGSCAVPFAQKLTLTRDSWCRFDPVPPPLERIGGQVAAP